MTSIKTNMTLLNSARAYTLNEKAVNKSMEHISSGQRVNHAEDDAAAYAMAARLTATLTTNDVALKNISDGNALLQTRDHALLQLAEMVLRIKECAMRGVNGGADLGDHDVISSQINQLNDYIESIMERAIFNGQRAFIPGDGHTITIRFGDEQNLHALDIDLRDISAYLDLAVHPTTHGSVGVIGQEDLASLATVLEGLFGTEGSLITERDHLLLADSNTTNNQVIDYNVNSGALTARLATYHSIKSHLQGILDAKNAFQALSAADHVLDILIGESGFLTAEIASLNAFDGDLGQPGIQYSNTDLNTDLNTRYGHYLSLQSAVDSLKTAQKNYLTNKLSESVDGLITGPNSLLISERDALSGLDASVAAGVQLAHPTIAADLNNRLTAFQSLKNQMTSLQTETQHISELSSLRSQLSSLLGDLGNVGSLSVFAEALADLPAQYIDNNLNQLINDRYLKFSSLKTAIDDLQAYGSTFAQLQTISDSLSGLLGTNSTAGSLRGDVHAIEELDNLPGVYLKDTQLDQQIGDRKDLLNNLKTKMTEIRTKLGDYNTNPTQASETAFMNALADYNTYYTGQDLSAISDDDGWVLVSGFDAYYQNEMDLSAHNTNANAAKNYLMFTPDADVPELHRIDILINQIQEHLDQINNIPDTDAIQPATQYLSNFTYRYNTFVQLIELAEAVQACIATDASVAELQAAVDAYQEVAFGISFLQKEVEKPNQDTVQLSGFSNADLMINDLDLANVAGSKITINQKLAGLVGAYDIHIQSTSGSLRAEIVKMEGANLQPTNHRLSYLSHSLRSSLEARKDILRTLKDEILIAKSKAATGGNVNGLKASLTQVGSGFHDIAVSYSSLYEIFEGTVIHDGNILDDDGDIAIVYDNDLDNMLGAFSPDAFADDADAANKLNQIWNEQLQTTRIDELLRLVDRSLHEVDGALHHQWSNNHFINSELQGRYSKELELIRDLEDLEAAFNASNYANIASAVASYNTHVAGVNFVGKTYLATETGLPSLTLGAFNPTSFTLTGFDAQSVSDLSSAVGAFANARNDLQSSDYAAITDGATTLLAALSETDIGYLDDLMALNTYGVGPWSLSDAFSYASSLNPTIANGSSVADGVTSTLMALDTDPVTPGIQYENASLSTKLSELNARATYYNTVVTDAQAIRDQVDAFLIGEASLNDVHTALNAYMTNLGSNTYNSDSITLEGTTYEAGAFDASDYTVSLYGADLQAYLDAIQDYRSAYNAFDSNYIAAYLNENQHQLLAAYANASELNISAPAQNWNEAAATSYVNSLSSSAIGSIITDLTAHINAIEGLDSDLSVNGIQYTTTDTHLSERLADYVSLITLAEAISTAISGYRNATGSYQDIADAIHAYNTQAGMIRAKQYGAQTVGTTSLLAFHPVDLTQDGSENDLAALIASIGGYETAKSGLTLADFEEFVDMDDNSILSDAFNTNLSRTFNPSDVTSWTHQQARNNIVSWDIGAMSSSVNSMVNQMDALDSSRAEGAAIHYVNHTLNQQLNARLTEYTDLRSAAENLKTKISAYHFDNQSTKEALEAAILTYNTALNAINYDELTIGAVTLNAFNANAVDAEKDTDTYHITITNAAIENGDTQNTLRSRINAYNDLNSTYGPILDDQTQLQLVGPYSLETLTPIPQIWTKSTALAYADALDLSGLLASNGDLQLAINELLALDQDQSTPSIIDRPGTSTELTARLNSYNQLIHLGQDLQNAIDGYSLYSDTSIHRLQEALAAYNAKASEIRTAAYGVVSLKHALDQSDISLAAFDPQSLTLPLIVGDVDFQEVLNDADAALQQINLARAEVGVSLNVLDAITREVEEQTFIHTRARSGLVDSDFAQEMAELSHLQALKIAIQSMMNESKDMARSLVDALTR